MALTEQFNLASLPEVIADAFSALQDNFYFLALAQAKGSWLLPGWDTTVTSNSSPQDFSKPDIVTLTKTYTTVSPNITRTLQIEFTYTGDNPTTIVYKFGDGTSSPELVTVTGGTMTCTYDGSGNLKTAVSS
jgi:hypothetical protein